MSRERVISKSTVVPVSIDRVWELVTTTNKFHGFGLPGSWDEQFDREEAGPGTPIKAASLTGVAKEAFIVEWAHPYLFSLGPSVDKWYYQFRLMKLDWRSTEVNFSRVFNKKTSLGGLFWSNNPADLDTLVDNTIRAIALACSNMSRGRPDGVWEE